MLRVQIPSDLLIQKEDYEKIENRLDFKGVLIPPVFKDHDIEVANIISELEIDLDAAVIKNQYIYDICLECILSNCKLVGYTHVMVGAYKWDPIKSSHWLINNYSICCGQDDIRIDGCPAIWKIVSMVDSCSPIKFYGGCGNSHQKQLKFKTLRQGRWELVDCEYVEAH